MAERVKIDINRLDLVKADIFKSIFKKEVCGMSKISAKLIDWKNGWMYGVSPAMERRVVGEETIIGEWVEVTI